MITENDMVLLARDIRLAYRNRSWGKVARLRKFGKINRYFPPEYEQFWTVDAIMTPESAANLI